MITIHLNFYTFSDTTNAPYVDIGFDINSIMFRYYKSHVDKEVRIKI